MKRIVLYLAAVALLVGCSSMTSPTGPQTEAIHGDFFERPWSHSRFLASNGFNHLAVKITFQADYNDWLWIEVWDGSRMIGQTIAKGYFDPTKRLEVDVVHGETYEVRVWTDKCCTRYEGVLIWS
ncbi:MAG TPA: hypothetical protein VEL51_18810 [Vicinamibacterales bacterium]|nr:hypothetical protein [Vicinamibacterales bacterium]